MSFRFSAFCYKCSFELGISDQETVKSCNIRQDTTVNVELCFYCPLNLKKCAFDRVLSLHLLFYYFFFFIS